MRQSISILSALLISIAFFQSCDRALEIDVPTSPPKLVLNSIFAEDSIWRIEVSTSAGPGQGNQIRSLDDCEVSLWQNDKLVKDIVLLSEKVTPTMLGGTSSEDVTLYYYSTQTTLAQQGKDYKIKVAHPNYGTIHANGYVPYPADLQWRNNGLNSEIIDVDGKAFKKVSFTMHSNAANLGYFAIQLFHNQGDGDEKVEFLSSDPIFNENQIFDGGDRPTDNGRFYDTNDGIFFSSQTFSRSERTFEIFVESRYLDPDAGFTVRILTLTPELYLYLTGLQRQQNSSGNPFAEPVQVYSNVLNGFGIFGGSSITDLPLQ